jgi:hypothetical protein
LGYLGLNGPPHTTYTREAIETKGKRLGYFGDYGSDKWRQMQIRIVNLYPDIGAGFLVYYIVIGNVWRVVRYYTDLI